VGGEGGGVLDFEEEELEEGVAEGEAARARPRKK